MRSLYIAVATVAVIAIAALIGHRPTPSTQIQPINQSLTSLIITNYNGFIGINVTALAGLIHVNSSQLSTLGGKLSSINSGLASLYSTYREALSNEAVNYSEARRLAAEGVALDGELYGEVKEAVNQLIAALPQYSSLARAINLSVTQELTSINETLNGMLAAPSNATLSLYHPTALTVNVAEAVRWGQAINVTGRATGPPGRPITITVDGQALQAETRNGSFSASIDTLRLTPGNHTVTVYAAPYGGYGPAAREAVVKVVGVPTMARVVVSGVAVAGLPFQVGVIISPWLARAVNITIAVDGEAINLTTETPAVSGSVRAPLDWGTGYQPVAVEVSPSYPLEGGRYGASILVINPLQIAAPIALMLGLAVAVKRSTRTGREGEEETGRGRREEETEAVKAVEEGLSGAKRLGPNGERAVKALAVAIRGVERATGVELAPSMTLREYLAAASPGLGEEAGSAFRELIGIVEPVLYSAYEPGEEEVRRAEELARVVAG